MPVEWLIEKAATAGAGGDVTRWVPLDIFETPHNVAFGVTISNSGAAVFRVEHTFDNVLSADVSAVSFIHDEVSAANGNIDGNYAFGVRATRLAVVSVSASCNIAFRGVQVGSRGT